MQLPVCPSKQCWSGCILISFCENVAEFKYNCVGQGSVGEAALWVLWTRDLFQGLDLNNCQTNWEVEASCQEEEMEQRGKARQARTHQPLLILLPCAFSQTHKPSEEHGWHFTSDSNITQALFLARIRQEKGLWETWFPA